MGNHNITRKVFLGAAFKSQTSLMVGTSEEEIAQLAKTNIENYISLTSSLLPQMLSIRNGIFIYLSSFRSEVYTKGAALYSATKAFGEAYFAALGDEYGKAGVRSSSIRMGYFEGRMVTSMDAEPAGTDKEPFWHVEIRRWI